MRNDDIHFKCEDCNEQYHAAREHQGKMIRCTRCGKILTIPSGIIIEKKKKENKQSASTAAPKKNTVTSENQTSQKKGYLIFIGAILLLPIAYFFDYLYPLPLLLSIALFGLLLCRLREQIWAKAITGLLTSTIWGLSLLLVLLILLNLSDQQDSNKPPFWLIQIDNALIWSKTNLDNLSDLSLWTYLALVVCLVAISYINPKWELMTKYGKIEQIIGRISTTLIVITSFTFFAPTKLNSLADQAYFKRYKIIVREKLKQERLALVANELSRKINYENNATTSININLLASELKETFRYNEREVPSDKWEEVVKAAARDEVAKVMASLGQTRLSLITDHTDWGTIESNITSFWEENSKLPGWIFKRSTIVESSLQEEVIAAASAKEAVEGLKGVVFKAISEFYPDLKGIIGKYIEEALNTVVEYTWKGIKAPEIVSQLVNNVNRSGGKFDFFWKIAAFWSDNKNPNLKTTMPESDLPSTNYESNIHSLPNFDNNSDNITEQKRCGKCGHVVPNSSHVGQQCPYCGVLWAFEDDN